MMSAKVAALDLFKINAFWKKGYDIITLWRYDVTNKISLRGSYFIVDRVMSPKFGNHNTSMREVVITSILLGFYH